MAQCSHVSGCATGGCSCRLAPAGLPYLSSEQLYAPLQTATIVQTQARPTWLAAWCEQAGARSCLPSGGAVGHGPPRQHASCAARRLRTIKLTKCQGGLNLRRQCCAAQGRGAFAGRTKDSPGSTHTPQRDHKQAFYEVSAHRAR
jgi:hypothetical protein